MGVAPSGSFSVISWLSHWCFGNKYLHMFIVLQIIILLSWACRCCLALLRLHNKSWKTVTLTSLLQWQKCSSHVPNLSSYYTATRIISSSSHRHASVIGSARRPPLACRDDTTRKHAFSKSEVSYVDIPVSWKSTTGWAGTFCKLWFSWWCHGKYSKS